MVVEEETSWSGQTETGIQGNSLDHGIWEAPRSIVMNFIGRSQGKTAVAS